MPRKYELDEIDGKLVEIQFLLYANLTFIYANERIAYIAQNYFRYLDILNQLNENFTFYSLEMDIKLDMKL